MEEKTQPIIKFNIDKQYTEKLKVFFMFVTQEGTQIPRMSRSIGVVGYRMEEALEEARQIYLSEKGLAIIGSSQDYTLVDDIIARVNLKGVTIKPQVMAQPLKEKPIGKEGFIAGLKLGAEEYIENEVDKKELLRIIETIK